MAKNINKLEDLTPHGENANKGSERGLQAIEDSLREVGAARSIVADRNGTVLAGNQTLQKAVELGLGVRVVQTHGNELVVVQRLDVDAEADPQKAKQIAYRDNRANELNLHWDPERLAADIELGHLPTGLWSDHELAQHLKALDLEVAAGGAADASLEADATAEASHVRMVQLFLDTTTHPAFIALTDQLQVHYGTDNITDTVVECVKRAVAVLEAQHMAKLAEAQPGFGPSEGMVGCGPSFPDEE